MSDPNEEETLKESMPGVYLGEGLYRVQFNDLVEFYVREEDIINRLELRKLLKNQSLYDK